MRYAIDLAACLLPLRAGLDTSVAERGQHERDIVQQTHHKSTRASAIYELVVSEKKLRRHICKGSLFQEMSLILSGFRNCWRLFSSPVLFARISGSRPIRLASSCP
jgi:hypothetical protein